MGLPMGLPMPPAGSVNRVHIWAIYQNNLWGGVLEYSLYGYSAEKKISFLKVDLNKFNCAYWGV